ncbi:MAG: sigma-54 dependent transcriptional regulator [Bryobacteraceae bacterium]|jgi:two-component system response regulator AtoC
MDSRKKVLVCEGDAEAGQCIEMAIKSFGYPVQSVRDTDAALSLLQNSEVELSAVLLGVVMSNRGSLDILREIRAMDAKLPVIIVAGLWSTRDIVTALKHGATDFLCKPIVQEELNSVLASAFEASNTACKSLQRNGGSPWTFRSANPLIKEIESGVGRIGLSGAPVLIQGETGSGKEVLARKLHAQSARANKPFLKLNCAALPSELVESELFGYERGAFTGAFDKKAGIFELADGGTILLDEIGDMDIRLQAKLLQVLQDQEFRRIGGKETVKVNVRIIAATHRDLERAIYEHAFREDLYYRLNVIVLQVPPLRERTEDIIPLGEFLIRKHADQSCPLPVISTDLRHAMMVYNWPGNVRELENYMRKLVIFPDPDALARDLHARMSRKPPASIRPADSQAVNIDRRHEVPILEQVTKVNRQAETDAILAALDSTRWNRKHAAVILKIDYKSLLYKMKKLGIDDSPASLSERSLKKAASGD